MFALKDVEHKIVHSTIIRVIYFINIDISIPVNNISIEDIEDKIL